MKIFCGFVSGAGKQIIIGVNAICWEEKKRDIPGEGIGKGGVDFKSKNWYPKHGGCNFFFFFGKVKYFVRN